jgi:hypothetical protein
MRKKIKYILLTFSINVLSSGKQKLSSFFENCSISFTVKRLILALYMFIAIQFVVYIILQRKQTNGHII